jgi:hypothetical protein
MKMKLIFLLLFLTGIGNVHSQCHSVTVQNVTTYAPFAVGSMVEVAGLRNGPDYNGSTLFYPINGTNNVSSMVLVPGYQATQSSILAWATYLASRGFVCLSLDTNSLSDSPTLRAAALIDGMETIRQENNRTSSPVYQKINTNNIAVGGWSMGGGGAQLAAQIDPRIKAVLAIAPWINQSSSTPSNLNHNAPVIIISGELDPIAPPFIHSDVHYNYTPVTTPKLLFEVSGGSHSTPLNPYTGNEDLGNVAFAWLKLFLEPDPCYCSLLSTLSLDQNSTASNYLTNLDCSLLSATRVDHTAQDVRIFPNPVTDQFTVTFSNQQAQDYVLYDVFGQQIKQGKITSGDQITVEEFSSGLYFLIIEEQVSKIIKN